MNKINLLTRLIIIILFAMSFNSCEEFEMEDEGGYEIHKSGNLAAITTNYGCKIWNVSVPEKAKLLSRISVGYSNGVRIKENTIFISSAGILYAYNISDPGSPELVGSVSCAIGTIFIKENWLFIKDVGAVTIIDATDPSNMTILGEHKFRRAGNGWGIYVKGEYIYTANDNLWQLKYDSIGQIFDPKPTTTYAWGMASDGNYIYLSTNDGGLKVVDISDPLNLQQVCSLNCGATWGISYSDGFVYVIDQHIGPRKIDISNVTSPKQTLKISDSFAGHDILFDNGYLYCAGTYNGFYILDAVDLSIVFN
jgi:hypothetical protein